MHSVYKDYQKAFLVEPTKLRRLVDTVHERLASRPDLALQDSFEIFLAGNRHEEMSNLDDVLAHDNSRRHKITRVAITCSASAPSATRPEREVQVDFGRPKPNQSTGTITNVVAISVRGESAAWANGTLSEVEEQTERNWVSYGQPVVLLLGVLITAVLLLASQVVVFQWPTSSDWWLTRSDIARIETMLKQRSTLSDEDLRDVSTMQLRNVVEARRPVRAEAIQTRRLLFLAVPLLVGVGCVGVLLGTCYPNAVFLWGDEKERYANIVHRRKTIWGIIIAVTVVGVSSRLFFEGVSSWLPR